MSGRFHNAWSIEIDKPSDAVFEFVANPNTHGSWSPRPFHVVDLRGDNGEVGSAFISIGWLPGKSEHRNSVQVSAVARPSMIEFTSEDDGESFVNRFEFHDTGGRTTLTRTADWPKPNGAVGLIFPAIAMFLIGPDMNKGLRKLKTVLETD